MAKSTFLYVFLLTFLPTLAISSSHQNHDLKSTHFTLYQHDIFNQTDFITVPGVIGSNVSITTAPFGTLSVLRDNLTLTPDPSSKVVGDSQLLAATSSFDGLDNLSVIRFELELEDGLAGTISALGVANPLKPSVVPVAGGTGDFLLVQGYVTSTVLSIKELTIVCKLDFNLFWPPYAPHAIKG